MHTHVEITFANQSRLIDTSEFTATGRGLFRSGGTNEIKLDSTMSSRAAILAEISRITAASGKPPGRDKFERETGIKMSVWYPRYWLRWGDALKEAGLTPNTLSTAVGSDVVIAKYIELIRELGRIPLHIEVRLKRKAEPAFPSHEVFSKLGKGNLIGKTLEYCLANPGFEDVAAICKQSPLLEQPDKALSRAPIQGYVYMMRSGRRYKIGFTSSPSRRHREVRLDLPEPTLLVHSIETDDPKGIEAYWHRRFESKRVRGTEFFELEATDVSAFKRRKYQ